MKSGWQRFSVGLFLLLVAVAFAFWGFSKNTLTNDQRQILLWILPLASGFGAGAFAGSLSVKAKGLAPSLVITATSGFAVWFLSFFFLFPKSQQTLSNPSSVSMQSAIVSASNSTVIQTGTSISPVNVIGNNNVLYVFLSNQFTNFSTAVPTSAASSDLDNFTNEMLQASECLKSSALEGALRHSSNATTLLESAQAKGTWWAVHIDSLTESLPYMVAAFALDGTEKDPDLAYSLALKAFNLYGSQMHKATLAITSANLANARFKHGKYAEALDLQRKAIGIYESSPPGFMEAFAGTNFWRWYQNAAWLSCNTGDFVEANKFSRTAVEKHPSDATVPYRLTILRQLGSNEEVVSLMTQWFTPVINRRVISFAFKTNSNSQ